MSQLPNSCWVSHCAFECPNVVPQGRACSLISVIFEEETKQIFPGVRLIVVTRSSDLPVWATVQDCSDPKGCRHDPHYHTTNVAYRNHEYNLRCQRKQQTSGDALLWSDIRENLCTIIFELVTIEYPPYSSTPKVYTSLKFLSSTDCYSNPLRVLYDQARPFQREEPIMLYLHYAPPHPPMMNTPLAGPRIHMVRILPLSRRCRPLVWAIPLDTLRRVAWHAYKDKYKGWRRDLLSFGMVCKAWVPLLDLYFGDTHAPLPDGPDRDPADLALVARSLLNRNRGALIRKYTPYPYKQVQPRHLRVYFAAQNIVLSHATRATNLTFGYTHEALERSLIQILRGLREVQSLTLSPRCDPQPKAHTRLLAMDDIQKFIIHWPHLKHLVLCEWRTPAKTKLTETKLTLPGKRGLAHSLRSIASNIFSINGSRSGQVKDNSEVPRCAALETLILDTGKLTRAQFLFFACHGASRSSNLRTVNIQLVAGLTNGDLLVFLNYIASTIEYLNISSSFPKAHETEVYALDEVMPRMTSLRSVVLNGDLASVLTLSRFQPASKTSDSEPRNFQGIKAKAIREPRISFFHPVARSLKMEAVIEALDVTGWRDVQIHWNTQDVPNIELTTKARWKAKSRGISFMSLEHSPVYQCTML